MAQNVSAAVKTAFRTSPIKRKYKCTIDWLAKGDTPGTVTATEWNNTYFDKDNVANDETFARYKPFILSDSMRLSDNVRLLSNKYENGWLGANRSDALNEFDPAEAPYMIYDDIISARYLTVIGSQYNYPINFDLYYRDSTDENWVLCENYTNRDHYITVYEFGSATDIKGWKVEISKINLADMLPCIVEVQAGFREDISVDIIGFEIRKELEYQSEKSLPIGNISANTLDLKLKNTHQKYNPQNKDSYVYPYLKANRIIRPYIGIDIGDEIVYIPQGVFYSREFAPNSSMAVDIYAIDKMLMLNERDFESSLVYENYKNSELIKELVEDFGLGASEYDIDETDDTIPYAWFEPRKYAANIKRLAIAEGGYAFFDELGIFQYKKRDWILGNIEAFYTDNHILKDSISSPLVSRNMKNYIRIKSNPLYKLAQEEIYGLTQNVTIPAGGSKDIACYFSKKPCLDIINTTFTQSNTHITITSELKYSFVTFLTFANSGGTDENVTSIIILGSPLETIGANEVISQDADSIFRYGKSEYLIDSEFIQDLDYAQSCANYLLASYKDPEAEIEFKSLSLPYLQLGDLIAVKCKKLNMGGDLF